MENTDILHMQKHIFGNLFYLRNKLQVIMDQTLAPYDLTTQQWYLLAVMEEFFQTSPTLGELANRMGSSHQNVKQIALKLQGKGFLRMEKDSEDRRTIRIVMTDKSVMMAEQRGAETDIFFNSFFQGFTDKELTDLYHSLLKLSN
ncbi:hypothetical protein BHU72_05545 [Desulfuribacillus stibiiarsenatis]|uniref:HTH marR-type domain-containing protein n=1 Tax=Desulfuribacillus stibiiarsenatis TaxID=1390249 RepID=A0A1E5L4M5_9FIRM|nr:MarR family transcriptional regulator [Desulfuribacillus stibiiarsenatis]OEH85075.1 hypothetical protein BHU72_05545 [Desulfuribacillus stibiiarsenatis]